MPQYEIEVPGYGKYRVESPTELTDAQAYAAIQDQIGKEPKPEGGFLPAAKAGLASLKSDVAGVLGRTGLMDVGAAEKYRAEQEAYRQRTFKPTEEGWTEAPVTKIKELLGGSVPYMAAPIVAGGAAALAGAPALAGLGAGALASAGQFVGSGLSRQVEEGTPLAQTNLQAAALAAIPSAALDMVGFRMIPGVRQLFGAMGTELAPKAAAEIAKQGVKKVAADYTRATGKAMTAEGLTEAGQQVLERLQAGLNITDPAARQEYLDSFIGGAVLGGTLAPAGRFLERGREQAQAQQVQQDEAAQAATVQQQQEAAAAQQKAEAEAKPEYAQGLRQQYVEANVEMQRLNDAVKALSAQKDPLSVADAKDARAARDAYAKETMQPLVDEIRRVRQLHPGFDFRPTAPVAPTAAPTGAATSATPEAVAPVATPPEAVVPEVAAAPEAVAPAAVAPTKRAKKVEEEAVVSTPAPFTAPAAGTPEVVEEAVPTVTEVAPAKKAKGKKAAAVAPAVEDTTVEPTEPRTLEESVAAMQPAPTPDVPAGSQFLLPGTEPLTRTGAVKTPEMLRNIQTELKRLSKEFIVARQEGRKADALAITDRMRFLKEQATSTETGPRVTGTLETPESQTIETRQVSPTSPQALQTELARVRSLPQLTDTQRALVERVDANLPELKSYRSEVSEWLNTVRQGRGAPELETALTTRLADIERGAQKQVTPRELQGMLAKTAKLDLSNKERGLLRLVGENQSTIMADDGARRTVARWLSQDVGQGIGDATQALRKYFGIEEKAPPVAQADMFAAEKEHEVARAEKQKSYEEILNPPKIAERLAERDEAARKQREGEEKLAALPAKRVSSERRREMLRQIDEAPLKRQALEDKVNDANLSQAERDAAQTTLTKYLASLRKKAENKDATYATAYRLRGKESEKVQNLKKQSEAPGLTDAEREGLQARLRKAQDQLNKRDEQLARLRGVEIEAVETPEERLQTLDTLTRETYAKAVTEEMLSEQAKRELKAWSELPENKDATPKQVEEKIDEMLRVDLRRRALGPVTRKAIQPAKVLYTGDVSQIGLSETEKRTYTKPEMRLTEKRGVKQRDVQISKEEMAAANKLRQEKKIALDELAQEQRLFDTAQKKVEELTAKQSNIKDRIAAYSKLEKKKAEVQERLAAEKTSIDTELAGAKADAARLAPKIEETKTIPGYMAGETGKIKLSKDAKLEVKLLRENSPIYAARDTVDLTGPALEAVQDGRVLDALDAIGTGSNSPFVKELVKRLRPLVMRTKLRVEDNVMHDGKRAEGVYDFTTNTVVIDSQALTEEALLHEVTHAVTARLLTVDPSTLTAEQRAARTELETLFNAIQNDSAFEKEYGKLNMHEFASEVMSNKALRDKLDARKWRGASLLNKIYRAFMNLLGLNPDSMAGASVESIYKLFTPSTTAAKAGITMSPAGIAHPKLVGYAPGLESAGAIVDKVVAKERGAIDRIRAAAGGFLGLETQLVDRFAPLDRIAKGMEALKGSQMMYYLRMYDQRMNFTAQSVANGAIQRVAKKRPDGRTEYVVESVDGANIKQVVDILKKAPAGSPDAANRLFTMYLAGLRAKNKGFDTLHFGNALTEAQLDSAMASIRATPGLEENFKQAREVYNEYNRNMVGFLAQSGAISKEHAARLTKENDYIPFYREKDGVALLTIGGETPIRIGSIAEQPYLHELVGGDRPILDFLTSSVQNTALITDMGLRNLATKNTMNELEDMGLAQIRQGPGSADPKVVRFKVDGKDHYAIVDTDEKTGIPADLLVKGMQGIPTQLPAVVRALGMPATLIRRAVTLSPTYAARQLFRDSLAAPLLSGANFTPVLGALTELGKSTTKPTLEKRGITGGQIFAGGSSSEAMTKILNDMMSGKGSVGTLIAKAESLNMEADAATRRAQYNSYIKQGMSEMEATLMSLESMNFNKRGASPSIHMANALIPFFNSQIQGLNVLYKALTGKLPFDKRLKIQQKLLTRGALMFGASLAYAAMMQDDEAYKNATPEQKYGNWFVRIPGVDEPVKLPIPFEIGYLFKALPEAIYNSLANESGSEEAFKALKTIVLQTIPGGSSYFIPQALKPAIEYGMGKSFYTGRDIVSAREQQLLPEQQFRENSNEISKMMGAGLGLSPIKIEALVSGYTGTMGLALMQALSMGVPTGESPEKTAKRLSDMPVVGSSFQPNDAGGIINAVYERMNEVKKVKATVDRMLAEGRGAEAKELVNKHAEEFAQSGVADYFTSHMQQITKFENAIRASNMTGDEKRAKLDQTRQMKIRLAEMVRKATEEAKKVD